MRGAMLQVETVGDKYMSVSGLQGACLDHAGCIARLALDMMHVVAHLKDPDGNSVKVQACMASLASDI